MNTPTLTSPESQAQRARAGYSRATAMLTLVQRELWEHRALWITPLIVAGVLLVCVLPTHTSFQFNLGEGVSWLDDAHKAALFGLALWALSVPYFLVMLIVLPFYLLDCLYAERKDRSVLFWKSLPVSDGATVVSKLLVGLVVVPLAVFAFSIVSSLLVILILNLRTLAGHAPWFLIWDAATFFKVELLLLYGLLACMLWYAPIAAALLLASVWARRNVVLWATLVPLLAVMAERLAFGTHYVAGLIEYRTFGLWQAMDLGSAVHHARMTLDNDNHLVMPSLVFDQLHFGALFTNIDLWLGLAVAAALIYATIRIRRHGDDT